MIPFAIVLTDPVVRAYAEQRHFMLTLHLVLFVLLACALPFATQSFGMLGAVFVIVGINFLARALPLGRLVHIIGLERRDFKLLRGVGMVALAAAIAALVTALLRVSLPAWKPLAVLMVCGVCYTIVYLASVWIMKIPAPEERAILDRFLGRMGIQTQLGS